MDRPRIEHLLREVAAGRLAPEEAAERVGVPTADLGFARIDRHRAARAGFPEVVYAPGKTPSQLVAVVKEVLAADDRVLVTRAEASAADVLVQHEPGLRYHRQARLLHLDRRPRPPRGLVGVVAAGTSDIPVAEEAALTAGALGARVARAYDVGVAGLHRILEEVDLLRNARVLVVVAGMDGALASVVGGLTDRPVVGVPTSTGYGASYRGLGALLAMLNTCAPGLSVVNIDNGFGGGYSAALINAAASRDDGGHVEGAGGGP